jgi:hypothetical protein
MPMGEYFVIFSKAAVVMSVSQQVIKSRDQEQSDPFLWYAGEGTAHDADAGKTPASRAKYCNSSSVR